MTEKVYIIDVEEIGQEIAQECYCENKEELSIDHIYKDIEYALDDIREGLVHFAFKYLDENNIKYID